MSKNDIKKIEKELNGWCSVKWPDGSTYNGIMKNGKCEGLGVFKYSTGDRYEGEFVENKMQGYGVYVWKNGTGNWNNGNIQGCGVRISRQVDGGFIVQEGQFVNDNFLGTFIDCNVTESREMAEIADRTAYKSRQFNFLPSIKNNGDRNNNI